MNKRILNYTIAGVSVAIASFVVIKLTSVENEQSEVPKSISKPLELKVEKPVAPVAHTQESEIETSSLHSPGEDKHDSHNHDSEFYTEMMPHKGKRKTTPTQVSPPKTDDERLGYILGAEYVPVIDSTGSFTGLKISGLPEALSSSSSLQVKNGDVVTQINGTKIVDQASFGIAIERLYSLGQDAGLITFEVDRKGMPHSVSLDVKL